MAGASRWAWGTRAGSPARVGLVAVASLSLATLGVAALESTVGVADASALYLVAVVLIAGLFGTSAAVATSFAAFLAYDFLFTQPRFTLAIADPEEWLSLVLFLIVAVAIGRLAALLRERADEADRRVRESVSLVGIGRTVSAAPSLEAAAQVVATRLMTDTEMAGLRIVRRAEGAAATPGSERLLAEIGRSAAGRRPWTLVRDAEGGSDWVRIDDGAVAAPDASPEDAQTYRVPIEADGRTIGAVVGTREPGAPIPGRGARRILSLAADQLAAAARRDELREELTAVEVRRRGDALRGAILDSVSHDLRTPIATIRALAGTLADPALALPDGERRAVAGSIDREADRLAGLVRSLLDMSRVQAGDVSATAEPYDLGELVEAAAGRLDAEARARLTVALPDDLPPVLVDAALLDVALGNVLGNAARYAPAPAAIRVSARAGDDGEVVVLDVDDAGPGVPADALPRLFERFYRLESDVRPSRPGLGMGLAIARGFVEAMGGEVEAAASDLGGLRVRLRLPAAGRPEVP